MEGKKDFNNNVRNKIIWVGIAIAVFLWLVESFMYLYFHQVRLFNALVFPDPHDFFTRCLVVLLIIIFSLYSRNAAVKFSKEREKKRKIEEDYKELVEKVQIELQRSCQTIRDIISKSPFGIYLVNSSGKIDYVNLAMLEISGVTYEQFINLNILELPTYKKIGLDEKIRSALKGEQFSLKDVVYTSYFSNKTTIRDISGIPFEEAGEKKVLVFVEDITERKRLEHLKDDFVSSVSHELRTPLSIIKEGISLVLDRVVGSINEKQLAVLTTSKDNIDRLARIINELLDISRIESGKVELERKETDIVGLIKKIGLSFEQLLKEKGIELRFDFAKDKITVYIDADLISQVFINLVGNALKFTGKGSIKISVVEKHDMVECSVEDTGIGIEQENIPKLFEKFWQFKRVPGAGEKGTGLGLSIVKGIIELHNGKIWVESQPYKGSNFIFILPKTDKGIF